MKNNPFEDIIGQDIAKERLLNTVRSARVGGPMISPLLTGPPGNGKTYLAKTYLKAMGEIDGIETLSVSPAEIRSPEDAVPVLEFMNNSDRWVLHIDEAHLMRDPRNRTVWIDAFNVVFMKALDRNGWNTPIELREGYRFDGFNPKKGSIVFTTNFPEKLDKSGAYQSRFERIDLKLYTEDELIDILVLMLKERGFKDLRKGTLRLIAKCGRGTARPMEKIVGELDVMAGINGKTSKTLNKDEVLRALVLTENFPLGLTESEVALLVLASESPKLDGVITAMMPKLETMTLRRMKGYLYGLRFLEQFGSNGVLTTDLGKDYLSEIRKDKFPIPAIS